MSVTKAQRCKDCAGDAPYRPAPYPGPRCHSHWRIERNRRKEAVHETRVGSTYGLKRGEYKIILDFQGGRCAICRRATGKTKKLAVDHDHSCCNGPTSCGRCVRGLLCSLCNNVLRHLRDDPEAAARVYHYLVDPPAPRALADAHQA